MDLDKETQPKVLDLDEKRSKEERLKRLQKLIDAGEYKVSAQEIAESWLSKESLPDLEIEEPQSEKNSKTK